MLEAQADFDLCELAGELYATGGVEVGHKRLASVERYEPSLDTRSTAPAMPRPHFGHCACAVGDAMYVLGGTAEIEASGLEDDNERHTSCSVLRFDSRAQTWSEVASMPTGSSDVWACVLGSAIYIFGGHDVDEEVTSTTYRFSTETDTWTTLAPMPAARFAHNVCMLDGLIYVMGGADSNDEIVNSVLRFEPLANSWSAMAPMSIERTGFGAFVLGGSMHVVAG
jgi:N-acetylneuraminic acid mutarotase